MFDMKGIFSLFRETGRVGWLVLFSLFMPLIGAGLLFLNLSQVEELLQNRQSTDYLIFLFFTMLLVGASLVPSYIAGIVSGWLFGFYFGLLIGMGGIVLASLFGYWLSGLIISDKLFLKLGKFEKLKDFDTQMKNNKSRLVSVISLMRLSPVFPFAMTNALMASIKVPLRYFLAGTMIGMVPRTAVAVLCGDKLLHLTFSSPSDSWLVLIGLLASVVLVFFISRFSRKLLEVNS
jgi:uncharacterized membrane protein YdjX (TVP38/TMEM64 family)